MIAEDEEDACTLATEILAFLPDHNMADPPVEETADPKTRKNTVLETLVPDNPNKPYDMVKVVEEIVDDGIFVELFEAYADNIIIGFARLEGRTIGVVGNQPKVLAGCLDIDASIKAARFIRTCDAFNIPLVTFEDVPGFLPGVVQEWGWYHSTWGKIVVCLCRSNGAEINAGHTQSLRGRLPCHVLQALAKRLQRCVANCRTCRYGRRWSSQHHSSTRNQRCSR